MVWATWSSFVTVTALPGATVMVLGVKAKFLMVILGALLDPPEEPDELDAVVGVEEVPVVEEVLPEELEQAASTRALPNSVARSSRRERLRLGDVLTGDPVVCSWSGLVITVRSAPPPIWMPCVDATRSVPRHHPCTTGQSDPWDIFIRFRARSEYSFVMVDRQQASDANLVVAIGRWHEQALAEVYRRHGGAVHALARRILRSDPPAEEITQEVFLDLWNHPEKFDAQRGTLRSFLLARTHGKSVDYVRSEVSRRGREEKTSRETATAGYDIDREVWDMAVAEQVQEALGALPDDLRRPIELAYFGGHTYREVAEMLHEPEGTVKSRIRSGLGRLRVNLAERGVQPAGADL